MIHLCGCIQEEAQAFGRSIARCTQASIPLMDVGVLRLTNGFAGFFEDELRLLLGAGRLQELHCFGEFT